MTSVTVQANSPRDVAVATRTGGGFIAYVSLLREAFAEALQNTQEARRKYPFADV